MQTNSEMNRQPEKSAVAIAPHILLAEDDKEMRSLLAHALRRAGYEVVECCDGVELFEHLGYYFMSGEEHKEDKIK